MFSNEIKLKWKIAGKNNFKSKLQLNELLAMNLQMLTSQESQTISSNRGNAKPSLPLNQGTPAPVLGLEDKWESILVQILTFWTNTDS